MHDRQLLTGHAINSASSAENMKALKGLQTSAKADVNMQQHVERCAVY